MLRYLVVCSLIISRIEINVAKNNSSTTEKSPTHGDGKGLLNIHAQLLEIQDDIISISKAIGQGDNLDSIIRKIVVTDEAFKNIEDNLTIELHRALECSESAKTMLTNQYDAVSAQLKNLQLSFKEVEHKRLSSANTTEYIKGLTFNSTKETLKQLNNMTDVLNIIQVVYASSSDNSDLLSNLDVNSTDLDLIYNFVKAQQRAISTHDEKANLYKWIRLVKIMEAGVINQLNVSFKTKASAQDVVNEIYQSIRVFTVNALKAHVNTGAFEKNGEMDNLTTAVYLLDPSHSESIIEQFVNTSFEDQEYLKDIFDTILSHRFIQQRIKGLSVLFWKLKDSFIINNDVTIDIASALYKIHSDDEFKNLSRSMRIGVKRIIETLPACARNLYFLSSVCFWNRAKEEYLTAGNSTFNNDKERRNIFLSEDPLSGSHWYVERIGGNFLFHSRTYPNEYLYAADFNFNRDLRYLFSWIPGNNTDKQSNWNIRLNGNYCYIQSTTYYENMISSNYKKLEGDLQLSYVFTRTSNIGIDKPEFLWQIRKCD